MKKILIVEDDRSISELLKHLLEGQNYEVKCAFDGLEGLEKVRKFNPDLVMMDVNMPRMNGFQLLQSLKSSPKTEDIPVIMCTENDLMGNVDAAYHLGVRGYVVKPFVSERVIKKVKEVLENKQKA